VALPAFGQNLSGLAMAWGAKHAVCADLLTVRGNAPANYELPSTGQNANVNPRVGDQNRAD
jgi:hypothetical protein